MATILEFRAQDLKATTAAHRAERTGSAEVVIFPGVRYERCGEPPPVKSRGRRSRQRDRLELED